LATLFLHIFDQGKDVMRLKGIPQTAIDSNGTVKKIVDRHHYEKMANNIPVEFKFQTLLKTTKSQLCISSHTLTRVIHTKDEFKIYTWNII